MNVQHYQTNDQRYVPYVPISWPIAALAADATTPVIELGQHRSVSLTLAITTVSASDTLDVTIQTSRDGVNNWYSVGTFTQVTEAATERKTFVCDRFVRANLDVTGSSVSITGTLTGEAV